MPFSRSLTVWKRQRDPWVSWSVSAKGNPLEKDAVTILSGGRWKRVSGANHSPGEPLALRP